MKSIAIVPLKLNSRRLPNKNFLRLGDYPLAHYIFDTLLNIDIISDVYCYTSQPQVMNLLPNGVKLLLRPKHLDGDSIKANELFRYAVEQVNSDLIVLSHATGPYISRESIEAGIKSVSSGEYDSSFSVTKHKSYSWFRGSPLNYNPSNMSQTQNIEPIYVETSGFYVFPRESYLSCNSRIVGTSKLVEVDLKESIDIDEPEDFNLASYFLDFDSKQKYSSEDTIFVKAASAGAFGANIEHIAFDLDGVLIDSISVMENAWDVVVDKFQLSIPFENYKKYIGIPFLSILENLGVSRSIWHEVKDMYDQQSSIYQDKLCIYEGVIESLLELKSSGYKLSVVTSKTKSRAEFILVNYLSPDLFDIVVCPEDVAEGRGKPCPDPLLKACVEVGVDPANTLFVGDMSVDMETADRAKTHFAYANWGYEELVNINRLWFNEFKDLKDYLIN